MFIVPLPRNSSSFTGLNGAHAPGLDRLFDETFDRLFAGPRNAEAARVPALDIAEAEGAYTVRLEMPGVAREDVQVAIEGRRVTVRAQAAARADGAEAGEARLEEQNRVIYRERTSATYARSFTLPREVNRSEASAKLENGVLVLTLPKRQPEATHITVN
jgi:HSP20 family protein